MHGFCAFWAVAIWSFGTLFCSCWTCSSRHSSLSTNCASICSRFAPSLSLQRQCAVMLTSLARPGLAAHAADALLGRHAFLRTGLRRRCCSAAKCSQSCRQQKRCSASWRRHNNKSALGLAVTDPCRRPRSGALPPLAWSTDSIEAMKQIAEVAAEHDAGALAFALPLAETVTTDAVGERDALIRLVGALR